MQIPNLGIVAALSGALGRMCSPIAGATLVIAGMIKASPLEVSKRMAIPMIINVILLASSSTLILQGIVMTKLTLQEQLIADRRHLHAHPEEGWCEFETTWFIVQRLKRSVSSGRPASTSSNPPPSWAVMLIWLRRLKSGR